MCLSVSERFFTSWVVGRWTPCFPECLFDFPCQCVSFLPTPESPWALLHPLGQHWSHCCQSVTVNYTDITQYIKIQLFLHEKKNDWWFLPDSFHYYLYSITTFGSLSGTFVCCWPCFLPFCLACLVCIASSSTFSFWFREGSLAFVMSPFFLESLLSFAWALSSVGLNRKEEKNTAKHLTLRR